MPEHTEDVRFSPFTVLLGIILGTLFAIAFCSSIVGVIFWLLADESPRLASEIDPLGAHLNICCSDRTCGCQFPRFASKYSLAALADGSTLARTRARGKLLLALNQTGSGLINIVFQCTPAHPIFYISDKDLGFSS